MPTTVISYRAPASYRRCGDNLYDTRGTNYVAVRRTGSRANYVNASYTTNRTRYIAVRNADFDDAPRYVRVRRQPVYVESSSAYIVRRSNPQIRYTTVRDVDFDDDDLRYVPVRRHISEPEPGSRYVAVRSGYRNGNGIVAYIDNDVAPRYVAVRRAPMVKYVAVRNVDNGCMRAVALRSCADQFGTTSVKHVVVRDDDDDRYSRVITRDEIDDEDVPIINDERDDDDDSMIHEDEDDDVSVLREDIDDDDEDRIVPVSRSVSSASYVEYAPAAYYDGNDEAINARAVTYLPASYSDDDEINDLAYLDGGGTTYIAADDVEDACLSSSMRSVRYVPIEDDDDDDDVAYIVAENIAPKTRYVVLDDDDEVATSSVHYVAADDMDDDVPVVPVSYMNDEKVRYVPVDDVDTTYIAADDCPMAVSSVDAQPVTVAHVEAVDSELVAELSSTQRIAGQYGYRDGFEDGQEAALEGDVYHPENSGDYQKATEGYEDEFGDKDVYKDSYRSSYLAGYRAGFDSGRSV